MKLLSNYQYAKAIAVVLGMWVSQPFILCAQDITGQWNGVLNIQGMNMRIVFHISKIDNGYASTMDSPDQSAFGIPVTATIFDGSNCRWQFQT